MTFPLDFSIPVHNVVVPVGDDPQLAYAVDRLIPHGSSPTV